MTGEAVGLESGTRMVPVVGGVDGGKNRDDTVASLDCGGSDDTDSVLDVIVDAELVRLELEAFIFDLLENLRCSKAASRLALVTSTDDIVGNNDNLRNRLGDVTSR